MRRSAPVGGCSLAGGAPVPAGSVFEFCPADIARAKGTGLPGRLSAESADDRKLDRLDDPRRRTRPVLRRREEPRLVGQPSRRDRSQTPPEPRSLPPGRGLGPRMAVQQGSASHRRSRTATDKDPDVRVTDHNHPLSARPRGIQPVSEARRTHDERLDQRSPRRAPRAPSRCRAARPQRPPATTHTVRRTTHCSFGVRCAKQCDSLGAPA